MKNINLPALPQSRTSQRTAGLENNKILAMNDYDEPKASGPLSDTRKFNKIPNTRPMGNNKGINSFRTSYNPDGSDLNNKIAENIKREDA